MTFEMGNPNSTKNTVVFSLFEGPDNPHNSYNNVIRPPILKIPVSQEKESEALRIKLDIKDGPSSEALESTLKEIGAERQAYHGGSFNANHTRLSQSRLKNLRFRSHFLSDFSFLFRTIFTGGKIHR
ncbi:predicted protein [Nematostella vectensis]|uniref:Uncharacterized protein n=1 Tax=Nematostella vectensis TaxID=45351 RepID=A7ST40_NEMVE|nr:predicted protein [Nematostella vectensis]|eukprot:XP_001625246.1 predicted protein [Nematostella vectensis]